MAATTVRSRVTMPRLPVVSRGSSDGEVLGADQHPLAASATIALAWMYRIGRSRSRYRRIHARRTGSARGTPGPIRCRAGHGEVDPDARAALARAGAHRLNGRVRPSPRSPRRGVRRGPVDEPRGWMPRRWSVTHLEYGTVGPGLIGPAGAVGVEGGDDGGDVGRASGRSPRSRGCRDQSEAVTRLRVMMTEVVSVDGQGLLVISRLRPVPIPHARGGRPGSGRRPGCGTSPGADRGSPHLTPRAASQAGVRFRPAVPELVHGEVDRAMRPGSRPIPAGARSVPEPPRPGARNGAGRRAQRSPAGDAGPEATAGRAWPAHCAALARGCRRPLSTAASPIRLLRCISVRPGDFEIFPAVRHLPPGFRSNCMPGAARGPRRAAGRSASSPQSVPATCSTWLTCRG